MIRMFKTRVGSLTAEHLGEVIQFDTELVPSGLQCTITCFLQAIHHGKQATRIFVAPHLGAPEEEASAYTLRHDHLITRTTERKGD